MVLSGGRVEGDQGYLCQNSHSSKLNLWSCLQDQNAKGTNFYNTLFLKKEVKKS